MRQKISDSEYNELLEFFASQLNYEADDLHSPIEPLTYKNPEGDSCLHIAAHTGNYRAVEILLKAGLDVNQTGDMGSTALHYANMKNNDDIIKLLIDHGASTELRNEFGKLPLE